MKRRKFIQSGSALGTASFFTNFSFLDPLLQPDVHFLTQRDSDNMLFHRPREGQSLSITPPGLAWYPAKGVHAYRVKIYDENNRTAYDQKIGAETVHLPHKILDPGQYHWDIHALDQNGKMLAKRGSMEFKISEGATEFPWIDPQEILDRIPVDHPRVQFVRSDLTNIRNGLKKENSKIWDYIKSQAEANLDTDPPIRPTYHLLEDPRQRRLEYGKYFHYFRGKIDRALYYLSLAFLFSEEEHYARAAKRILMEVADWPTHDEDVSSVSAKWGDEAGLSMSRIAHKAYDWLYDSFSTGERLKVLKMCEERAWQTHRRLVRKQYLTYPGESHDTRMIAYLSGMAVAMKGESEGAKTWLEFSLKALTTTYPHWAGYQGGWAQGVAYGVWYNHFYIPAFDALEKSAGYSLWKRPFFTKFRQFYLYCTSPLAKMGPFGDAAERGGPGSIPASYANLMHYHAQRFDDPYTAWWVAQVGNGQEVNGADNLIFSKKINPKPPNDIPQSKVFEGVGWAGLHSALAEPAEDTFMLFKSSPYGSVSHSHGDQNSFAIMKGGVSLTIPSGYYGPSYGMPHHAEWTRSTKANNCILVNGEGQSLRDAQASGSIEKFVDETGYTYLIGNATPAYRGKLTLFKRHVLFLRPGIFLMLDELEAPETATFQWMMHSFDKMQIADNHITIQHEQARLRIWLYATHPLQLSQTDQFDTPFNAGIPEAYRQERKNQWHLTASTTLKTKSLRIASIMAVDTLDEAIICDLKEKTGWCGIKSTAATQKLEGWVQLDPATIPPSALKVPASKPPKIFGLDRELNWIFF